MASREGADTIMADIESLNGKTVAMLQNGWSYGGKSRDLGEIFKLTGDLGDERLLRLRYVETYSEKGRRFQCGACGAQFRTENDRADHGNFRHPDRFERESDDDSAAIRRQEREEKRMLDSIARNPIAFEKTQASLKA